MYRNILLFLVIVTMLSFIAVQPSAYLPPLKDEYDCGRNYCSDVIKQTSSYYNEYIVINPSIPVNDPHKIPVGAMELRWYLTTDVHDTEDPENSYTISFISLWAFRLGVEKHGFIYYDPTPNIPYDEKPLEIYVDKYLLTIRNTYYTSYTQLLEVSFSSIYVYDQDQGREIKTNGGNFLKDVFLYALETVWNFVINKISIPLPSPWRLFENRPGAPEINLKDKITLTSTQLSNINYRETYTINKVIVDQDVRRVFGISTDYRISWKVTDPDKFTAIGVNIHWIFKPEVVVDANPAIAYSIEKLELPLDIPNEPYWFAEASIVIYYTPPPPLPPGYNLPTPT